MLQSFFRLFLLVCALFITHTSWADITPEGYNCYVVDMGPDSDDDIGGNINCDKIHGWDTSPHNTVNVLNSLDAPITIAPDLGSCTAGFTPHEFFVTIMPGSTQPLSFTYTADRLTESATGGCNFNLFIGSYAVGPFQLSLNYFDQITLYQAGASLSQYIDYHNYYPSILLTPPSQPDINYDLTSWFYTDIGATYNRKITVNQIPTTGDAFGYYKRSEKQVIQAHITISGSVGWDPHLDSTGWSGNGLQFLNNTQNTIFISQQGPCSFYQGSPGGGGNPMPTTAAPISISPGGFNPTPLIAAYSNATPQNGLINTCSFALLAQNRSIGTFTVGVDGWHHLILVSPTLNIQDSIHFSEYSAQINFSFPIPNQLQTPVETCYTLTQPSHSAGGMATYQQPSITNGGIDPNAGDELGSYYGMSVPVFQVNQYQIPQGHAICDPSFSIH